MYPPGARGGGAAGGGAAAAAASAAAAAAPAAGGCKRPPGGVRGRRERASSRGWQAAIRMRRAHRPLLWSPSAASRTQRRGWRQTSRLLHGRRRRRRRRRRKRRRRRGRGAERCGRRQRRAAFQGGAGGGGGGRGGGKPSCTQWRALCWIARALGEAMHDEVTIENAAHAGLPTKGERFSEVPNSAQARGSLDPDPDPNLDPNPNPTLSRCSSG